MVLKIQGFQKITTLTVQILILLRSCSGTPWQRSENNLMLDTFGISELNLNRDQGPNIELEPSELELDTKSVIQELKEAELSYNEFLDTFSLKWSNINRRRVARATSGGFNSKQKSSLGSVASRSCSSEASKASNACTSNNSRAMSHCIHENSSASNICKNSARLATRICSSISVKGTNGCRSYSSTGSRDCSSIYTSATKACSSISKVLG